jgi:hypothetical protein
VSTRVYFSLPHQRTEAIKQLLDGQCRSLKVPVAFAELKYGNLAPLEGDDRKGSHSRPVSATPEAGVGQGSPRCPERRGGRAGGTSHADWRRGVRDATFPLRLCQR